MNEKLSYLIKQLVTLKIIKVKIIWLKLCYRQYYITRKIDLRRSVCGSGFTTLLKTTAAINRLSNTAADQVRVGGSWWMSGASSVKEGGSDCETTAVEYNSRIPEIYLYVHIIHTYIDGGPWALNVFGN